MTPITWQAAVDDEEQRPQLQDILEAAVDDRKTSSKQPSMGIMSRENSRGGFPLPSSRFLPLSVLLLDSSIIDTSMQGSCQRQPCCHRAVMVVQECCCAFELYTSNLYQCTKFHLNQRNFLWTDRHRGRLH